MKDYELIYFRNILWLWMKLNIVSETEHLLNIRYSVTEGIHWLRMYRKDENELLLKNIWHESYENG